MSVMINEEQDKESEMSKLRANKKKKPSGRFLKSERCYSIIGCNKVLWTFRNLPSNGKRCLETVEKKEKKDKKSPP